MTKEEKNATVVENTTNMEKPKTANYEKTYKISDVFINDLKTCLGDLEFNKADQFIRFAEAKKESIITAELQEFVNKLGFLPWRYVSPIMQAINTPEIMAKYFIENDKK